MDQVQLNIISWAAHRVHYLDSVKMYEDSYAVSQEFCEWTTCFNTYPKGLKASTVKVPNFDKNNHSN